MRRKHKTKYDERDDLGKLLHRIFLGIFIYYALYLFFLYQTERTKYWIWSIGGIVFLILSYMAIWYIKKWRIAKKQKYTQKLIEQIKQARLEDNLKNFINRFGMEGDKRKSWSYRKNYIDWHRIDDLEKFIIEKGIKLKSNEKERDKRDICLILKSYIQDKEENLTRESIKKEPQSFSILSGEEFEKLIARLFVAKGYATELIGRTGDQGGDLIANKNGDRVLIQAKCYKDWSTGNSAVQQAVAAMKYYDCNKAVVISTSHFTREAIALAKANNTILVSKEQLQKMLLDHLGESWK